MENERLAKILKILEEEQFCTTEYLSRKMFVVPVTIRRDLKKLEQRGLVHRCHGGASMVSGEERDVPLIIRENSNNKIKLELAGQAVKYISPGSTLFLDASSTAACIARLLTPAMDLTVITNGMKAAAILAEKHIKTYCTGGQIINNAFALAGSLAVETVAHLHADLCFFSSQGVDSDGNITDNSEIETQLRKTMIDHAAKSYFICDSSKIGKVGLFSVCNIQDIDGMICDRELA